MPTDPRDRPLCTVEEVAEMLSISKQAAYTKINRRQLPGVIHIGRSVRIDRAALLDWIATQKRQPYLAG